MNEFFDNISGIQMVFVGALLIFVWFLPVLVAFIFNRNQVKLIALACIPAGLSVIAWSALLVWAFTGKAVEKYLPEKIRLRLEAATKNAV